MGISAISIYNQSGTQIGTITGPMGIQPLSGCNTEMTDDGRVLLKAYKPSSALLEEARQKFMETYRYITTINDIGASETGDFTLAGSACFGWLIAGYSQTTPGNIKTAMRVFPKEQGQASDPTAVTVYSSAKGGAIRVYDACPTCSSCDTLYQLRTQIEYMKEMLNAFKDSSLYPTVATADAASYTDRQTWLHAKRRTTSANCPVEAAYVDSGAALIARNNVLLGQYAATVHMWNYAVSQNNTSVDLNPINGDTSGFSVQVKRAFPNCGAGKNIRCVVDIQPVAGSVESDLSVYVTQPTFVFRPFTEVTSGGTSLDDQLSAPANSSTAQGVYIQTYSDTSPIIVTHSVTGTVFAVYESTNIAYITFIKPSNYRFKSGDTISWSAESGDIPIGSYTTNETDGIATLVLPTGTTFQYDQTTGDLTAIVVPLEGGGTKTISVVDATTATITQESTVGQTQKTIYANALSVPYAGTYVLTFKFLPFIYGVLKTRDSSGNLIPVDITDDSSDFWNSVGQSTLTDPTEGTEETTYFLEAILDTSGGPLSNPTLEQYNASRMYPSKSTSRLNRWHVTVTWTLELPVAEQAPSTSTYTEEFYFQTSGVRRFINGIMRDSKFVVYPDNNPQ